MEFIRDKRSSTSSVMALGVGGAGGNAANLLYNHGEKNISFLLCNTDKQDLDNSPIPFQNKILLGEGDGAGNRASEAELLAEKSSSSIEQEFRENKIKMVFIIAGMGGGTGTGVAPVIARIAKNLGILTIGVVTIPFESEGRVRVKQAVEGIEKLSKSVDSLIIINNSSIDKLYGKLGMSEAYNRANELIEKAVKSISDIITRHFIVNVDFADVCRVMRNSGIALMGTGVAKGENRVVDACNAALTSPLLYNQDITGSKNALVCITSTSNPRFELRFEDAEIVAKMIQRRTNTGNETDIIWGAGHDDTLDESLQVTVIVTGFNTQDLISSLKDFYKKTLLPFDSPRQKGKLQPQRISFDAPLKNENVEKTEDKFLDEPIKKEEVEECIIEDVEPVSIVVDQQSSRGLQKKSPTSDTKSESTKIYWDPEDTRPAYVRRSVKLVGKTTSAVSYSEDGVTVTKRRKQSLVEEKQKSAIISQPSLFDDI